MGGYLRDSVKQQIGIWRANQNGIVGDGFPVPPHTRLRIQWDGKPVPYEENRYRGPRQIPVFRIVNLIQ